MLVIFNRNIAERVCYRMVICYPTSPNVNLGNCVFSHAGYSPRPLTTSDRNEILRDGWSLEDSFEVQTSSKSVKWFRSCWESKFALSHWFGHISCKTAKSRNLPFLIIWNQWESARRVCINISTDDNDYDAFVVVMSHCRLTFKYM